jgi:hypothetical protein
MGNRIFIQNHLPKQKSTRNWTMAESSLLDSLAPETTGPMRDCLVEKRDESRDWPFYHRGGYADQAHFDNAFETRASSAPLLGSLSDFDDKELDGEILRGAGFRTANLRILS